MPLTWPDLIIEIDATSDSRAWLEPWRWLVTGRVGPRFLNRFGCWFLQRPDGSVHLLDVFYGDLEEVAPTFEAFQNLVNDPGWQQVYLLSGLVAELHANGVVASGTSCYAIAPHPSIGGPDPWGSEPVPPSSIMVMDVLPWQGLCSQFVRFAHDVAPA